MRGQLSQAITSQALTLIAFSLSACSGVLGGTSGSQSESGTSDAEGEPTGSSNTDDGIAGPNNTMPDNPGADDPSGSSANGGHSDPSGPFAAGMWRLTQQQYQNTVADLFGVTVSFDLEPDEQAEAFLSVGAAKVGTSARGIELYDAAATQVADAVFQSRDGFPTLASCTPNALGDPCVGDFVASFGRSLFRRPLEVDEVERYVAVAEAAGEEHLEQGMHFALRAMLNSPNFLYVGYAGEPEPGTDAWRFTSHEMAARLSYVLLNSTPDPELHRAADEGLLTDPSALEEHVRRLLESDRARSVASRFFAEHWLVSRLDETSKDTNFVAAWSSELLAEMRAELQQVVEQVVFDERADVRTLLTRDQSMVGPQLAELYGLPAPESGFHEVELGETRSGLLTSAAVVAANSPQARTSPTLRGMFVLEKLLCIEPPPPPPEAVVELEEGPDVADLTTRERLERHRDDPACAGCHGLFDPLGMAFENFGPIGEYRTEENGKPVDVTGTYAGQDFSGVQDLAEYLFNDERLTACLVSSVYEFATAHEQHGPLDGQLETIHAGFESDGFDFVELLVRVVTSEGFRYLERPNH